MSGRRSARVVPTLVLLAASLWTAPAAAAPAAGFEVVDGAAAQLQSRRYEVDDPKLLLRASVAVLQDIRYMVTESETEPGLLVAEASWRSCRCRRTLTISLQQDKGREGAYLVRLTSTASPVPGLWGAIRPAEDVAFYQDFFSHLDREIFRETRP